MQIDRHLRLNYSAREIFDGLLLMLVLLAVVMQISQFVLEQCLWFVNSENAACVGLSLFVELSVLSKLLISGFGAGCLLGTQSLPVKSILFYVIVVRNAVFGDHYLLLLRLQVLFRIQQMAADKGRIVIVGIGPPIFVWAVESCAHLSARGLLIEVYGPAGWAFGHFMSSQMPLADAFVHI